MTSLGNRKKITGSLQRAPVAEIRRLRELRSRERWTAESFIQVAVVKKRLDMTWCQWDVGVS